MLHKNPDTCLLCCWVIPNPAGFIGSCKEAIGLTAITECHKAHILYLQITGAVTSDKNIYIQEPVSTRCLYLCFGGWGWSLPALGSLLNGVIAAPTPLHLGGQIPEKQSGENRRLFVTLGTSSSTALAVASVGEASALAAAGWQRSLLCPRGKGIQESWICGRAHRLHAEHVETSTHGSQWTEVSAEKELGKPLCFSCGNTPGYWAASTASSNSFAGKKLSGADAILPICAGEGASTLEFILQNSDFWLILLIYNDSPPSWDEH